MGFITYVESMFSYSHNVGRSIMCWVSVSVCTKCTKKGNLRITAVSDFACAYVCVYQSLCARVYVLTLVDCAVSVLSVGRWRE